MLKYSHLQANSIKKFKSIKNKHLVSINWIVLRSVLIGALVFNFSYADETKTPEQLVEAFVAMFNNESSESTSKFVDSYMAKSALDRFGEEGRERYIGYFNGEKRFHKSLETIEINKIAPRSGQTRYQAKVRSYNTELWYTLTLYVSPGPDYKVTNMYLQPSNSIEVGEDISRLSKKELAKEINNYVERLAKRGVFSGAILIADKGEVLYQDAKGLASIRYDAKNTIDTKFNLGSMNKMFTSISVLQLVHSGKLALDDKLIKYVDRSYFSEGDFDGITIRQLLTHTSGLGWAPEPNVKLSTFRKISDSIPYLKNTPLSYQPGTRFNYSNTGMQLLGMVIEKVSDQSYYDYVRENIYQPAGMQNTDSYDVDLPIKNLAMGYYYSTEMASMQSNLFVHTIKGGAAGGGYSTIGDLHKFAQALNSYQLLPKHLTEQAYSAKPKLNSQNYGYGFSVSGTEQNRIVGHSGSFIGVSSRLNMYLDKNLTVAVLCNTSFASEPVIWKINQLVERL